MTLEELNGLPPDRAAAEFTRCCGSARWARTMTNERPFADADALAAAAHRVWSSLAAADWLEAFSAHTRIGGETTSRWSAEEQSAASSAPRDARDRIARGNFQYEQRFGYTFIVCATGRLAGEILASLEERLGNSVDNELIVAAEEQRKITELRLRKLITS